MKKIILALSLVVFLFGFVGCEKSPVETGHIDELRTSTWECVIEDCITSATATVTLAIDSTTNLVIVSTSPVDIELQADIHNLHPFWNGSQYILQNDKLYSKEYIEKHPEGSAYFSVTKISADKIELSYMGGWWADGSRPGVYLFNKKRG